jgi:hypothetical protein
MWAGLAFNSESTTDTKQQRGFWTMMTTPVGTIDLDFAIRGGGESCALLVAVGAQIAHAAIEGGIEGFELDGVCGPESKIIFGKGGVNLMAGAAIDVGGIWIGGLDVSGLYSLRNAISETTARVTSVTNWPAACILIDGHPGGHYSTCTVDGRRPGILLARNHSGVIMALRAGQIGSLRCSARRSGRAGRTRRASWASRSGLPSTGRQHESGDDQGANEQKYFFECHFYILLSKGHCEFLVIKNRFVKGLLWR